MNVANGADNLPHLPRTTAALSRDIEEELASHLAFLRDELVAQGWSEEAAAAEALRRFGDPNAVRDACIAISNGVTPMWMRISVGLNILFALLLLAGLAMYLHAARSARAARDVAQRHAQEAMVLIESRLRQENWSADRGTVRIEGKVARPGEYPTSIDNPRSLLELLDDAGGLTADAASITVRRSKHGGEESRPVASLRSIERQPADVAPGPGDVIIVW